MPSISYSKQNINTEIAHSSRDHVIAPDTVKSKFNFDTESTEKTRSIVKIVG